VGGGKVALLFLTRGHLHHEPTWKLWFRSAAGILPAHIAAADTTTVSSGEEPSFPLLCSLQKGPTLEAARNACSVHNLDSDDAIASQHLFSVYVHLSAEIDPAAVGPLWRSRLVQHRVPTEWGTHSLVEATRSLLWEAFKDPANQRFVLVSEADVPIWDPLTFYHELMAEQRSRVDAWWHPDMDLDRWSWRMALSGARIRRTDWRKSAQWFSLLRSHVHVALQDEVVFTAFEDHCRSAFDGDYGRWRECYSDEHYLPTLLHMKGLQEETVPSPLGITAADWSEGNPHPHEYTAEEVVPELFTTRLRNNSDCPTVAGQHTAVQEAARKNFVTIRTVLDDSDEVGGHIRSVLCNRGNYKKNIDPSGEGEVEESSLEDESLLPVARGPSLMQPQQGLPSGCSLLARKFSPGSAEAVTAVFQNCTSGLMLIGDAECTLYANEHETAGSKVVSAAEEGSIESDMVTTRGEQPR
jgi:Core-2/I-Branching enzyme